MLNSLWKRYKMNFFTKTALVLSATFAMTSLSANAQQQGNITASGWFKVCNDVQNSKVCNVQFRVLTREGNQLITSLNLIQVTGEQKRSVFRVLVPTGRSLPPGIQIQVDGKRAVNIPYAYCRPNVCAAEAVLNDQLVQIFKAGGGLEVTSLNFQSKPNKVPITLKGFTSAYDGAPLEQETTQSREELLKQQLEQKLQQQ